jgi:hypothetical protein
MCIGPAPGKPGEVVEGDGAQRMGGDAERRVRHPGDGARARRDEALEAVAAVEEPPLPGDRRRAAEVALGVEDRQQGQPDAGRAGRRRDALRRLGDVLVRPPVRGMVQVVELADRREAGLQHLGEGEGRDGLDGVGVEAVEEAVHDLAPGPEAVGRGAAALGQARHAALEAVAVQVGQAGHRRAGKARRIAGCCVRFDRRDEAVRDRHQHVVAPALGQERGREMQLAHGAPGP